MASDTDPGGCSSGVTHWHFWRDVSVRLQPRQSFLDGADYLDWFVVDDAIVVIENVSRYLEQGMAPVEAALKGAREVGFTVLSISLSLVAVFTPILLMGGIVGRLFREFAVTLSTAILVSLVISLTTTPMMCARLLRSASVKATADRQDRGSKWRGLSQLSENVFWQVVEFYKRSLRVVLQHRAIRPVFMPRSWRPATFSLWCRKASFRSRTTALCSAECKVRRTRRFRRCNRRRCA